MCTATSPLQVSISREAATACTATSPLQVSISREALSAATVCTATSPLQVSIFREAATVCTATSPLLLHAPPCDGMYTTLMSYCQVSLRSPISC